MLLDLFAGQTGQTAFHANELFVVSSLQAKPWAMQCGFEKGVAERCGNLQAQRLQCLFLLCLDAHPGQPMTTYVRTPRGSAARAQSHR